ncbi:3-phosphoshikimate 1-carboxyvinyltransferase [Gemmatimonadota bacterium]
MDKRVAEPVEEALVVKRLRGLKGVYRPPGDKSISHRALILGACAEGTTRIQGLAPGADVRSTWQCLKELGVAISHEGSEVVVEGTGWNSTGQGFDPPSQPLDCGNSGTTARLLAGVLAAQRFETTLTGDESLAARPMERIAAPLRKMGADVELTEGGTLPMRIAGHRLQGIAWESPVASAQVKSAVLLAALGADGETEVIEPVRSRDHTERMLRHFGADLETKATGGGRGTYSVKLLPGPPLEGREVDVPGDISSAVYLVVAALLTSGSDLILEDVGMNPGRREALNVLSRMGGRIEVSDRRTVAGEQRAKLRVRHSRLKGVGVSGSAIPWLIDEIPILAVAAAFAEGESYFTGADELRNKESDRIEAIVQNLKTLDVEVGEYPDGFILRGKRSLDGGSFKSFGDHRIALAFHVAALACHGESVVEGHAAADVSWPDFPQVIEALRAT